MYETDYDFETDWFNTYDEDETLYSYLEENPIDFFFKDLGKKEIFYIIDRIKLRFNVSISGINFFFGKDLELDFDF